MSFGISAGYTGDSDYLVCTQTGTSDPEHQYVAIATSLNGGKMDGFVKNAARTTGTDGHWNKTEPLVPSGARTCRKGCPVRRSARSMHSHRRLGPTVPHLGQSACAEVLT